MMRESEISSCLHTDHLGSSSLATDASGNAIPVNSEGVRYYAYGAVRSGDPANLQTDRTFTGQKADETGLMFFEARYYDNSLGTFLSPDTMVPSVSNAKSYNRYMYVLGNPLKFSDPTGHMEAECLNGEGCTRYQTLRPNRNTPPPTNSGPSGTCRSVICLSTPTPTPSVDLLPSWGPTPTPRAQIGPQQYFVAPYVTGDIDQGVGDVLVHNQI